LTLLIFAESLRRVSRRLLAPLAKSWRSRIAYETTRNGVAIREHLQESENLVNMAKPKMSALVTSAIRNLREIRGSTSKEIMNYIRSQYAGVSDANIQKQVLILICSLIFIYPI